MNDNDRRALALALIVLSGLVSCLIVAFLVYILVDVM